MKSKLPVFFTTIMLASILTSSLVSANLYVKPAKLGTWRLELFPFSTATVTDDFQVGNTYDFPINVRLFATGNITNMTNLSTDGFVLVPNETKTVNYTVELDKPGTYTGGIAIQVSAENKSTNLVYQADLNIFVRNNENGYLIFVLPVLAVLLVVAYVVYKKKRKGKK